MAFSDAADAIAALSSVKATEKDIIDFVRQLSVECNGSVTVLYSGKIGDANAWEFVSQMGDDVRRIDRTMAAEVLNSNAFKAKVAQAFNLLPQEFEDLLKDKNATHPAKTWLNKGGSGPWAVASEMFVEGTTTPIRFLAIDPLGDSVLVQNEWQKAFDRLKAGKISSLEGLTAADLSGLTSAEALERLKSSSLLHIGLSGLKGSADGARSLGDFLKSDVLNAEAYAKAHPEAMQRFKDFLRTGVTDDAQYGRLKMLARGAGKKLGTAGALLVFGFALSESANAAESGDTEKARQIMESWAIDAAGSSAGAAIGGTVVTIAAAAAVAAGAVISAPVLAALAIGGAIVGGIWGSKAATDAWTDHRGSADNDELNLLEKLSAQLALSNYHLVFGTKESDTLTGTSYKDYLFGGGGDDVLKGFLGDDMLRGGAGNDTLEGGAAGADSLYGGDGNDTYIFETEIGNDLIVDSDGQGQIVVNGLALTGGKKIADGVYRDDATGWSYTQSNGDLILTNAELIGQIRVRDWQAGQLGINLDDSAMPPQPSHTYLGDFTKKLDGTAYRIVDGNYVADGAQVNAQDAITGSNEADSISGFGGNDVLAGMGGHDLIDGGDGDDLLLGGWGRDTLRGGAGNDYIYGSGVGTITLPTSTNTPPPAAEGTVYSRGFGWVVYDGNIDGNGLRVYKSKGVDIRTLQGDDGNVIDGGAGNDRIAAGSGDDIAHGGDDDDTIWGMAGYDVLYGDAGDDYIVGDGMVIPGYVESVPGEFHGADVLDGGTGNDTMVGQGGDDELYGGEGNDVLYGDQAQLKETPAQYHGRDYLDGGDGNDQLTGGGGDDELFGGVGDDSLWGDSGSLATSSPDYLGPQYHGNDYLDGEDGKDYLQGEGGNDTLFGGTGNDTLLGDSDESDLPGAAHGDDYLDGEEGDDQLAGHGGGDTLFGGAGNDTLFGDTDEGKLAGRFHGDDYLDGEDGDDMLAGDGGNDTLFGGAGNDTLIGDADQDVLSRQFHGNDYLDGEDGNDLMAGFGGNDTLFGGAGNDNLMGDAGQGQLAGEFHGADYLDGEGGDDTLFGGGGGDTLLGGDGNDNLLGDAGVEDLDASFHRNDYLDGGAGNDSLWGNGGSDTLLGGQGNDYLVGDDDDLPVAYQGNDWLSGGDGSDTLKGGGGDDTLYGDAGSDLLEGGDGDDLLVGGLGADDMRGGAGNDTYLIAASELSDGLLADSILDTQGHDRVVISGVSLDAASLTLSSGTLALSWSPTQAVFLRNGLNTSVDTIEADGRSMSLQDLVGTRLTVAVNAGTSGAGSRVLGGAKADTLQGKV